MLLRSQRVLRGIGRRIAFELTSPGTRKAAPAFANPVRNINNTSQTTAVFSTQQRLPPFACSGLFVQRRVFSAEKDENKACGAEEATAVGDDTVDNRGCEGEEGELDKEMEMLRAEVSEKTALVKDLNDKLLRTLADMENLRERTRRQAETAEKFAIQGFCKDLLDVADNLSRAVATVETDVDVDADKVKGMLISLHEGVLMVEKQLASTFGKHGVQKFDPTGDEFDPNAHMALFNVPDGDKPAGTIAAVTKAGYKLHDRVIRPAEVGVYQSP